MNYSGFYFDRNKWEILVNPKNKKGTIKIPSIVMLLLAPALGGLFVMFLPLLGFYLLGKAVLSGILQANPPVSKEPA